MIRLAVNRNSVHIDGINARTQGGGNDTGDHVTYFAETACGALTRGRFEYRTPEVADINDMSQVLKAAQLNADINGRKLCRNCAKAAQEIIDQQ